MAGFSLASLGLVVIGVESRGRAEQILSTAPLRFIGRISYGCYLFHPLIYRGVFDHLGPSTPTTATSALLVGVAFVLTLLMASVSFYTFERQFLGLKEKYSRSSRRNAPGSSHPMDSQAHRQRS
jgi:peptidoglycan/LPS O-acetylase OafA/YrhL